MNRPRRRLILGLAALLSGPTLAGAQQNGADASEGVGTTAVWGLHLGGIQTGSISAGALFDLAGEAEGQGPVVALEVGLDGGQVRAGYGAVSNLGSGYLVSASLLRTWRDPGDAEPDEWYYGLQAQLHLFQINVRGQAFYGPEAAGGDDWRFTASVGIGL